VFFIIIIIIFIGNQKVVLFLKFRKNGWEAAVLYEGNSLDVLLSFCIGRNEPEFIDEIIEWVNLKLVKKTYFQVAQYPVGIEFVYKM
jgi:hypothetical protein